jgi:hypothetical protein
MYRLSVLAVQCSTWSRSKDYNASLGTVATRLQRVEGGRECHSSVAGIRVAVQDNGLPLEPCALRDRTQCSSLPESSVRSSSTPEERQCDSLLTPLTSSGSARPEEMSQFVPMLQTTSHRHHSLPYRSHTRSATMVTLASELQRDSRQ